MQRLLIFTVLTKSGLTHLRKFVLTLNTQFFNIFSEQIFKENIEKIFLENSLQNSFLCIFDQNSESKNIGKIQIFQIFNCYINNLMQDFYQEKICRNCTKVDKSI